MIRGLQKQIIQLTTPKSKYFEVVFFVLRPRLVRTKEGDVEMVREAQKIVAESAPKKKTKEPMQEKRSIPKKQKVGFFFFGLLCGCFLSAVLMALLVAFY